LPEVNLGEPALARPSSKTSGSIRGAQAGSNLDGSPLKFREKETMNSNELISSGIRSDVLYLARRLASIRVCPECSRDSVVSRIKVETQTGFLEQPFWSGTLTFAQRRLIFALWKSGTGAQAECDGICELRETYDHDGSENLYVRCKP